MITLAARANIVEVSLANIDQHPQAICFINPQHPLYPKKIAWLGEQYRHGLRIKLLYLQGEKRPVGFIESVPGESCWRAVNVKGYLFIHCLWTTGKKYQHLGLGTLLLQAVEKDAASMLGIAAIASDGSFMAGKEIFLKNGYELIAESGTEQLLVKRFKKGAPPAINDWRAELKKYKELSIVYAKQCPWVARFIEEARPIFEKFNLQPVVTELKTAAQAQKAPSLYGVFNLIYNGRLLADRYISTTRLANILKNIIHCSEEY
ncbi:MAG TPA: GNAT family N-acetyltransferase [Patescibacteria group bacterium]|nr:GNAT family N-acetyltransferase [Patescibacteria group bacterium]